VRAELEALRFEQNAALQGRVAFETLVEKRRLRVESLAGSRAELERLRSQHLSQREDTRRDVLRSSLKAEIALVQKMKAMGVKSFAGLADAWG
jgi:hypothetical protein